MAKRKKALPVEVLGSTRDEAERTGAGASLLASIVQPMVGRRRFLEVGAGAVAGTALTACGPSGGDGGPQAGGGEAGGPEQCNPKEACDFLLEIAPTKPARTIPGAGLPFPAQGEPDAKWMEGVYKDIIDMWEAVQRLERMAHYGQTSQQVGGSVLWKPPQTGQPPQGAGSPPPPSFPL